MSYYTSIIFISWLALGVLSILIRENDRLARADKRMLYLTYALIAVSALAEWCGVHLDGREDISPWMLILAKTADFILTPMAGGALLLQMRLKNRWQRAALGILAANAVLQIISAFNGWMVIVDESHHYTHGPLYELYLAACLAIIVLIIIEFVLYGRSFRRQNRGSLYGIMLLVVAGIVLQEVLPSGSRTTYIALTLAATLMFIHCSEFSQLAMDDTMSEQRMQIDTDSLTGLLSRSAYSGALKKLEDAGPLPKDLAAFTVDINGLKRVNDRLGHEAGDELIRGAAECIVHAVGEREGCFRTGGDEFVVLTSMGRDAAENVLRRLESETDQWRGDRVHSLSVSAGFALAADFEEMTAEALVRESDKEMYKAKAAYYRDTGRDRRNRRR